MRSRIAVVSKAPTHECGPTQGVFQIRRVFFLLQLVPLRRRPVGMHECTFFFKERLECTCVRRMIAVPVRSHPPRLQRTSCLLTQGSIFLSDQSFPLHVSWIGDVSFHSFPLSWTTRSSVEHWFPPTDGRSCVSRAACSSTRLGLVDGTVSRHDGTCGCHDEWKNTKSGGCIHAVHPHLP